MPYFREGEIELYYETHGDGYPVLLIAPGGMRSAIPLWDNAPWNPVEQLRKSYRVIVMDQRNAGRSRGPVLRKPACVYSSRPRASRAGR